MKCGYRPDFALDPRAAADCFFAFAVEGCAFAVSDAPDETGGFELGDAGADFCMASEVRAGSRCCVACEGTAAARKRTKATTAAK